MKKYFYWLATLFQILFLITAYGLHIFSQKKMGLMRYLVYINREWEKSYPIHKFQYIIIALFLLFAVLLILKALKIKKGGIILDKMSLTRVIFLAIVTTAFIILTFALSPESYRPYYFISLLLAVITLIQVIKIFVDLKRYPPL